MHVCVLSLFSHVWLFVTLWTIVHQAPLSVEFSRQEYWSGLPCPPLGDLPYPGIEPMPLMSPALAGGIFTTSTTWEATFWGYSKPNAYITDTSSPFLITLNRCPCLQLCRENEVHSCPPPRNTGFLPLFLSHSQEPLIWSEANLSLVYWTPAPLQRPGQSCFSPASSISSFPWLFSNCGLG